MVNTVTPAFGNFGQSDELPESQGWLAQGFVLPDDLRGVGQKAMATELLQLPISHLPIFPSPDHEIKNSLVAQRA